MSHVAFKPEVFNLVGIDIKDLPLTPSGNRHVLVIVDYFSKYVIAAPLQSKYPPVVVQAIINNVYFFMGTPKMMLSDRGGEFKNFLFERVKKLFYFEQRFTSPYHPQSNGLCERCNGIITVVVGKICEGEVDQWDLRLPEAVFMYNVKQHSATGLSPFNIVFGKRCQTAVDRAIGWVGSDSGTEEPMDREINDGDVEMEVTQTEMVRSEIRQYADQHQQKANRKNKEKYDKKYRVADSVIRAGDFILKMDKQLSGKMHGRVKAKWTGPFLVVATTKNTVHIYKDGNLLKGISYHLIKKYHDSNNPGKPDP